MADQLLISVKAYEGVIAFGVAQGRKCDGTCGSRGRDIGVFIVIEDLHIFAVLKAHLVVIQGGGAPVTMESGLSWFDVRMFSNI